MDAPTGTFVAFATAPGRTAADGAGGVAPASEDPLVVYVTGAVRKPGVYQLPDGKRIIDAIEKAGGVTPKADAVTVNLATGTGSGGSAEGDSYQSIENVTGSDCPSSEHSAQIAA